MAELKAGQPSCRYFRRRVEPRASLLRVFIPFAQEGASAKNKDRTSS